MTDSKLNKALIFILTLLSLPLTRSILKREQDPLDPSYVIYSYERKSLGTNGTICLMCRCFRQDIRFLRRLTDSFCFDCFLKRILVTRIKRF
jgi:hypothetical protein